LDHREKNSTNSLSLSLSLSLFLSLSHTHTHTHTQTHTQSILQYTSLVVGGGLGRSFILFSSPGKKVTSGFVPLLLVVIVLLFSVFSLGIISYSFILYMIPPFYILLLSVFLSSSPFILQLIINASSSIIFKFLVYPVRILLTFLTLGQCSYCGRGPLLSKYGG
jgi:hypothetical protein